MDKTMKAIKKVNNPKRLHSNERRWAMIFIAVPLLGFSLFTVFPMISSVYFSLTDYNPVRHDSVFGANFILFKNYIDLFTDPYFLKAIVNTLFFLISIFVGMILGLLLATFLRRQTKTNKVLRIIYYLPAISSAVAINIVWRYLFNGEYGLINHLFGTDIQWLGTDFLPIKLAVIIKNVWAGLGGTLILYVAGLNNISETYYEASEIDGANKIQQFLKITLPLIRPISFYIIVTGIIGGLQSFADSQLLAAGNPEAQTIVFYIWQKGIDANRYGLASAASIILGVFIMIVTIIQFSKSDIVKVD